jgi:spermidine synthase
VTRWRNDVRLFIDGHLQFSSVDEHRYHEALVHPAAAASPGARRALILGGGDGMTAREVLKYPSIERVDLVDLDEEMIRLFRDRSVLSPLCGEALSDPRVHVRVLDAGKFLEGTDESWDLIFIDLPDPNTLSLSRLYTTSFYRLLSKRLNENGIAVTQATSPFYAADAFWCIVETWRSAAIGPEEEGRFNVYPYHAYVPSFGDWGFVMASRRAIRPERLKVPQGVPLRFLTNEVLPTLFVFPADSLAGPNVQPNRLDDQVLAQYYHRAWRRYGP